MTSYSDDLDAQIQAERAAALRAGTGRAARDARANARRRSRTTVTHCPEGHEYIPETTYMTAANRRLCLVCHAARRVHAVRLNGRRVTRRDGRPAIDLTSFIAWQAAGSHTLPGN